MRILACAIMLSVVLFSLAGCWREPEPSVDGEPEPGAQPLVDRGEGNPMVRADISWMMGIEADEGRAVQDGDIVIIDFIGTLDGVAFEGGSAERFELTIGSGMFVPGFEEQLIGMVVGDVRDIYLTFPEDYPPDLANQDVAFNITLHAIKVMAEHSGTFVLELYPEYAPRTVENFVGLVEQGFYDGTVFHRIVDGFMAQGGCPYGQGVGGSGTNIQCETIANGWLQNTLGHTPGVISMAHAGTNTGSSQFFLMLGDAPWLDGQHTGFGRIVEGFETVQSLQGVPRTFNHMGELASPIYPVTITSMTVIS